ncbi:hypothetical protein RRG08_043103 [Elysia crispata]|uniref:Uncharacterized protein n=1 Tax=Elysia crispata TaxID=231223 RepID=A0AAE0XY18_9GAST|nr:hypothetical protein RRG08_043103 [Elysia crispata]
MLQNSKRDKFPPITSLSLLKVFPSVNSTDLRGFCTTKTPQTPPLYLGGPRSLMSEAWERGAETRRMMRRYPKLTLVAL